MSMAFQHIRSVQAANPRIPDLRTAAPARRSTRSLVATWNAGSFRSGLMEEVPHQLTELVRVVGGCSVG
jgi:hypothetical protein